MSFIWPWVLVSLLALPLCAFAYVRFQRRRASNMADLGTLGVVREGSTSVVGKRRHIPPLIFLVGIALLAMASARPQITLPLPRLEGTVLLTFDASASMAAEDVEPTRMDAAKDIARALVERRPEGAKIGAVAFGEGGLLVQPPTDNDEALYATIDRLVPQSGTSLGRGMLTALNVVTQDSGPGTDGGAPAEDPEMSRALAPAVIVLLTDGENNVPPEPIEIAQLAIERGVRVHTVGVGTSEGTVIEVDGFNLSTRLNEPILEEIALLTEGIYFKIENADDVPSVYTELEKEFIVEPSEVEITSTVGGVSAVLLLVGSALSLIWFGRIP